MARPNVKPCPFCGMRNMVVNLLPNEGIITCPCGARMRFENTEEFFEHVTGDIYRKIPRKENEMNREILFRGKRVDNGEWVEGAYFPCKDGTSLICTNIVAGTPVDETGMCITWTVDHATVGQWTGLTDKNGKKIFEGDIVEGFDFSADDDGYGVVTWDDGGFLVSNAFLCGSFVENYNGRDFEVIGNVHDN